MAKFAYINTKNDSTSHTPFYLNCRFYFWVSFKKDINLRFRFRLANKLADKLKKLMEICCQNLLYA